MAMRRRIPAVLCSALLAGVGASAGAQHASTAGCTDALALLDRLQADAAAHPPGSEKERERWRAKVKAVQVQAARACLGNSGAADREAERLAVPPPGSAVVVPLPALRPQREPSPALRPPTPVVVTPPRPPTMVTNCDPGGCWTNDGTRIQKLGPTMVGPKGVCTVVGGITTCPP
jgi:hypothetical protein